jgi:hypothetical protein
MPYNPSEKSLRWKVLNAGDPAFVLEFWRSVWIEATGVCTYTLDNALDPVLTRTETQKDFIFGTEDQKNKFSPLTITVTAGSITIHYFQNP